MGIGSGAFSYLNGSVYSNTFSLREYHQALSEGYLSVTTRFPLDDKERFRYHFMMRLFGLSLDKREFVKTFAVPLERALWKELAFMRLAGAFSRDDSQRLELSPVGRYLLVVLMREFFIGVNTMRDQARLAPPPAERQPILDFDKHLDFGPFRSDSIPPATASSRWAGELAASEGLDWSYGNKASPNKG